MRRVLCGFILITLLCVCCAPCANASDSYLVYADEDDPETVYENPEAGEWRYESATLRIEIKRYEDPAAKLVWTEAEIWVSGREYFRMIPNNPSKRMTSKDYVHAIAKKTGTVFAMSGDFAHQRIADRSIVGILVRDGVVLSEKTRTPKTTRFPNLDTLALFADGDMRVFEYNELLPQDYLDMGVTDVLAFGPYFIRDGELQMSAITKYGVYREPRIGIGMYEKGHYLAIMAEGRHDKSKGISVAGLAQMFYIRGCTLAFNLDGGQTAAMAFMGKQITRVGNSTSPNAKARKTAEIFGIGFSQQLLEAP